MNALRLLPPVLVVAVAVSCSAVQVESSGETGSELASARTYAWSAEPSGDELDPDLGREIRQQVDADLASRGMTEAAVDPDLMVTAASDVEVRTRENDPYYFFPLLQRIEEGSITLIFTDPKSGALRWQGTGRRELRTVARSEDVFSAQLVGTDDPRVWDVPETVSAILAKFPAAE